MAVNKQLNDDSQCIEYWIPILEWIHCESSFITGSRMFAVGRVAQATRGMGSVWRQAVPLPRKNFAFFTRNFAFCCTFMVFFSLAGHVTCKRFTRFLRSFYFFKCVHKPLAVLPAARSEISGPNFLENFRTLLSVSRGSRYRKCTFFCAHKC